MRLCRLRQVNPNSRLSVPVNNVLILSRLLVTGRETISKFHTWNHTSASQRVSYNVCFPRSRTCHSTSRQSNRLLSLKLETLVVSRRGEKREGEINFVTGSRCRERERERESKWRKGREESKRREAGRGK